MSAKIIVEGVPALASKLSGTAVPQSDDRAIGDWRGNSMGENGLRLTQKSAHRLLHLLSFEVRLGAPSGRALRQRSDILYSTSC